MSTEQTEKTYETHAYDGSSSLIRRECEEYAYDLKHTYRRMVVDTALVLKLTRSARCQDKHRMHAPGYAPINENIPTLTLGGVWEGP